MGQGASSLLSLEYVLVLSSSQQFVPLAQGALQLLSSPYHEEVPVSVIHWKGAFEVDPLEWLCGFDKGNLFWTMELRSAFETYREPACHFLDLIDAIRQVLGSHKVVQSGHAWMAKSLVKLEEGIFSGHGAHSPGKCVSWDVISTRAIDDIKTEAGESDRQRKNLSFFIFPL